MPTCWPGTVGSHARGVKRTAASPCPSATPRLESAGWPAPCCRPGWCAIEITPVQHDPFGAYLFIEDDGQILRFRIDSDRVRIGRDETNDIWIDNPAVRPHTLLVYAKDQEHCIKVYEGAKVLLNGVPVAGMHRLYSGDRIGIADREFLYGRDDTPAECSLGLTVLVDGVLSHGVVFRRTRIRIGRRDADLLLNDAAVSDRHLMLECYGPDGVYALDLASAGGTYVRGERLGPDRVRVTDGMVLSMGRIELRVHILPSDAHGLLLAEALPDQPKVPLAAPAPMNRSAGQRHDPGVLANKRRVADARPVSSGFIRPLHQANAARPSTPLPDAIPAAALAQDELRTTSEPLPQGRPAGPAVVPVTEIGSLQQILQRAQLQKVAEQLAQRQPAQQPERARQDLQPAVRVKPELMPEPGEPPPLPRHRTQPQDESWESPRARPRELPGSMVPVSASPTALHEQRTDVLDTDAIRARTAGKASWLQEAEAHFVQRPQGAPLTQALDLGNGEERYRLGRGDAPQTWVGKADEPAPPPARRFNEPPRQPKALLSEAERAANPGLHRIDPNERLDGPVQDRHADPSRRHLPSRVIDRSRRLDTDDE
jgi:pSer/pThr/pTyr-binding forkhead associated (FHA) protein